MEVLNPLMQSPLVGGSMTPPQESQLQGDPLVQQIQMRMQQRDQKTPGFLAYFKDVMDTKGYPTKTMQEYESQFPGTTPQQIPLGANINMLNVTPPSTPVSEQTPLPDLFKNPVRPKSDDPIRQGFFDSKFYKPNAPTTMDVVNYTYQGKPFTGSSSNISQFQEYLDSIGKGNLIQRNDKLFSQETGPLQPMRPETGFAGIGINNLLGKIDEGIGAMNPYDNQLNFNDRSSLNTFVDNLINNRLKEFFGGIMGMLDV